MKTIQYNNMSSQPLEERESSLRDILTILFRHQNKIILFFITIVAVVTITTFLLPEIYQSDARLLIKLGRENVSVDPAVVGPTVSISQSHQNEINSELAILNSRFLAEAVVDELGVERFNDKSLKSEDSNAASEIYSGMMNRLWQFLGFNSDPSGEQRSKEFMALRSNAIKKIIENLSVSVEKDSKIINMSFMAETPQLAHEVLQSLIDSYQGHHINVHQSQASPQFFQEQSRKLLEALNNKEEQLRQFRMDNNIASMNFQREEMLSNISELQNEIGATRSQISSSRAKIISLEKALKNSSETIQLSRVSGRRNPAADQIKSRLIDLRLKEKDLSSRYPDNYRLLVDLRDQIKLAEDALEREQETHTEITTGVDTNYQAIELLLETERSQLQADIAREKSMKTELEKRKQELSQMLSYETRLNSLNREMEILKKDYLKYTDNLQRAKISAALDMDKVSNVSIVQPPTLPFEPAKPNKPVNIAFGIFIGLFGSVGLAFISEFFDDTIKSNEDIEHRLNLPVLATISKKDMDSCI